MFLSSVEFDHFIFGSHGKTKVRSSIKSFLYISEDDIVCAICLSYIEKMSALSQVVLLDKECNSVISVSYLKIVKFVRSD